MNAELLEEVVVPFTRNAAVGSYDKQLWEQGYADDSMRRSASAKSLASTISSIDEHVPADVMIPSEKEGDSGWCAPAQPWLLLPLGHACNDRGATRAGSSQTGRRRASSSCQSSSSRAPPSRGRKPRASCHHQSRAPVTRKNITTRDGGRCGSSRNFFALASAGDGRQADAYGMLPCIGATPLPSVRPCRGRGT